MLAKTVEGRGFDWNLSYGQKQFARIICGILGFGVWALYSTPNTIDLCVNFTKDVDVFGFSWTGEIMGFVLGAGVSLGELVFIYLAIWKSNIWWIGVAVCAIISIYATMGFQLKGIQIANIKYDQVQNAKILVNELRQTIQGDRDYLRSIMAKKEYMEVHNEDVPDWIYLRIRQTNERINKNMDKLNELVDKSNNTQEKYGAIISPTTLGKENLTLGSKILSIIAEVFLILFTWLAVGLKATSPEDKLVMDLDQREYDVFLKKYMSTQFSNVGKSVDNFQPAMSSNMSTPIPMSSQQNIVSTPTMSSKRKQKNNSRQGNMSTVVKSDAIYATYREWERQKKNINVKTGKPNMSTIAQKYGVKRQHVSKVVKDKLQEEKDIRHYIL